MHAQNVASFDYMRSPSLTAHTSLPRGHEPLDKLLQLPSIFHTFNTSYITAKGAAYDTESILWRTDSATSIGSLGLDLGVFQNLSLLPAGNATCLADGEVRRKRTDEVPAKDATPTNTVRNCPGPTDPLVEPPEPKRLLEPLRELPECEETEIYYDCEEDEIEDEAKETEVYEDALDGLPQHDSDTNVTDA